MNADNPLDFNTDPEPFWKDIEEDKRKMKYDEIIPKCAEWYSQSYEFVIDWLRNIRAEWRKAKKSQKRGMPYKRTLKQWQQMYGENDLADIVRCARKVMDAIIRDRPQLKDFL